ncbi:hypothetical protein [Mycoplasma sp. 4044]
MQRNQVNKIKEFLKRNLKRFVTFIVFLSILLIAILSFGFKAKHPYSPSLYNYGSYLKKDIIDKVKSRGYNYKVFNDINDFTVALNNGKAAGGVGSDFQAAQLIIENRLKKFNFANVFNTNDSKPLIEQLANVYRPSVIEHLKQYDQMIFDLIATNDEYKAKRILDPVSKKMVAYDVDRDGKEDHFWEYIIPYYTQDKVIAYSIDYENRPYLKLSAEQKQKLIDEGLYDEENESIIFKDLSWTGIMETLKKFNYRVFAWNNAYYDNMMIGAFYENDKGEKQWVVNNKLKPFNEDNYLEAIKGFEEYVKAASGYSLRDTKHNFLIGDGLELANNLIEPKEGRADVAVMYNGDAIDAYYSADNFSSLKEEGLVRYVRPKDNFLLMDGWIQANVMTDDESIKLEKTIGEYVFGNIDAQQSSQSRVLDLEQSYINTLKNLLISNSEINEEIKEELEKIKDEDSSLYETSMQILNILKEDKEQFSQQDIDKIFGLHMENEDALSDYFAEAFTDDNIAVEVENFDYINYTPANQGIFAFIEKWYFGSDEVAKSMYIQPEQSDDYKVFLYQIINRKLRTAISLQYFKITKS